jgi:hypothetical protein
MKRIKIHWGYRVAVLYTGFASLIIFLVSLTFRENIDLVTPDYYAQELKYQEKKESIERNNRLENPARISRTKEQAVVIFPANFNPGDITGTIHIFRPSDKELDFQLAIRPDDNNYQIIDLKTLTRGLYRIKVSFKVNGEEYFLEEQIVVS